MPNAPRIELPRPAIIALLGALLLAVTFVVTKGSSGESSPISAPNNTTATSTGTGTTTTPTGTGTGTGTTTTPAKPAQPDVKSGAGLPPGVARALNREEVVVLLFAEPGAADDQATRRAFRTMRSVASGRVASFSDTTAHLADYRRVIANLGVSQTPALVVVDKNRRAEVLEGFVDSGTLTQAVQDARAR